MTYLTKYALLHMTREAAHYAGVLDRWEQAHAQERTRLASEARRAPLLAEYHAARAALSAAKARYTAAVATLAAEPK